MLSGEDVAGHNSRKSCWVIISSQAYDVTDFLDEHPGGPNVILRYAGKDATEEYESTHPPGTIENNLTKDKHKGPVDMTTVLKAEQVDDTQPKVPTGLPPLRLLQNLDEIERVATNVLNRRAFTYFHSAADSLASFDTNLRDWNRISFRPRVLRDVAKADMRRSIMGQMSNVPFFIAPAARAKLAHKDGECALARASLKWKVPYAVSTVASCSHEEIIDSVRQGDAVQSPSQHLLFYQLYLPRRMSDAPALIRKARDLGFKALLITVDTPVVGKREEDERYQAEVDYEAGADDGPPASDLSESETKNISEKPILRGFHSSTLNWDDLSWIQREWNDGSSTNNSRNAAGPVVLKGIQTAEDAELAYEMGLDGIYLSNHGGRQLDHAPSSIRTLLEIRKFCPHILGKIQIYVDGGVRRGTDVLKAICLGATAVGVGRPFMYSLIYGQEGVEKAMQLLSDEVETGMRLLGVNTLDELSPNYVNTKELERDLPDNLEGPQGPLKPRL